MASLGLAWETSQPTAPAPLDGRHADRDTLPFQPRFIHRPDLRFTLGFGRHGWPT